MSQENAEAVRGLLAHAATRFALLLSLFGALGLVACDDDESATAETEVITSDFGQVSFTARITPGSPAETHVRPPARRPK